MISFIELGNLGRLGNQMFQYAALKGIAANRGYDYCVPLDESFGIKDEKVKKSDCNLYGVFDLCNKNKRTVNSSQRIMERMRNFDEDLFNNCPDNIDLFGYFQCEDYFKHIEDDIRKDFTFKKDLDDKCVEFLDSSEYISLHVRRGDYVESEDYHPLQTPKYYEKSLEFFSKDIPVIIFSDDSEWCKTQELFSSDRFLISENNSTDFDLCLMSKCHYHIIANSSFSWWGAWLAKSKKIIAPKNWFGGKCIDKDVNHMKFGDWDWV
jgi:hypothetical protein